MTLTLVSRVQEELHDALVADLYKEEVVESLLAENAEVVSRRKRCREVIALLESSIKAINDVQSSMMM